MTSGNPVGEPIVVDEAELHRLGGVPDGFLTHDRPIAARADDSVVRLIDGHPVPLRRARGYVPDPLPLPVDGPPVLAVGGELENTVCLAAGGRAILSQHLGDLSSPRALAAFEAAITHLRALTGVEPVAVACDLHPDYRASRWARASGLPVVEVQHHHAHLAACLAEHGRVGPVVGVAFDGTGYGPDGNLWGGEVLRADLRGFERLGHLRPLRLLGGERAIREPWRLAVAALLDAGEPLDLVAAPAPLRRLHALGVGPLATGAGRWFDAVAALCSLRREISYEGQAAIELEAAAVGPAEAYPFTIDGEPFTIDLRPTVRAVAADVRAGVPAGIVAARFHETLARAVHAACRRVGGRVGAEVVALSGGCFANRRLTERVAALLRADGVEALCHRRVPPNDGGLALGQAAVAVARLGAA